MGCEIPFWIKISPSHWIRKQLLKNRIQYLFKVFKFLKNDNLKNKLNA